MLPWTIPMTRMKNAAEHASSSTGDCDENIPGIHLWIGLFLNSYQKKNRESDACSKACTQRPAPHPRRWRSKEITRQQHKKPNGNHEEQKAGRGTLDVHRDEAHWRVFMVNND